jgi:myosin heavy subunit
MTEQNSVIKKRTGLNILLGIIFVVLAGGIIYLMTELSGEKKDAAEMKETLELQKENLTKELNELNMSFTKLRGDNESMNQRLDQEKQKIQDLLAIKASNSAKIKIYEAQVTSLRGVLKSYIIQVDSLNQANLRLRAENKDVKDRFDEAKNTNKQLEEVNKNLQGKVEAAAVLKALSIVAEPIDNNGTVQKKIKKVQKIKVCFNLGENAVAKKGPRKIYMRIANPSQRVMVKSGTETFTLDGNLVPYSAMREVEYEGSSLEVCIYYETGPDEIVAGTYYIDLYLEGAQIGTTSFSLR